MVREEFIFINNLASSFTGKLKGHIIFTATFLEEIFVKFLSKWEKKVMLPIWQIYKKRENPLWRILFLSRRIPDRQTSWIIIKFYFLIFISSIQEHTCLWLQNIIFNFPTSAAQIKLFIEPCQRSRELHTSRQTDDQAKCHKTVLPAWCLLAWHCHEKVKIASLPKYCACSSAMPMKINNVSTIRTCHCILRQQISSQ